MGEQDWLAQRFEDNRTHLTAVAYRMLGSFSEADDAVQESWLRLSRSGASGVENLGGWLTTVVARVCLHMLRSRKARREEPPGTHPTGPRSRPEHQAKSAVPGPLPPPSRGVREPPNRRSSTEPPASYGLQVEGRAWSSPSRLRTGGSSR